MNFKEEFWIGEIRKNLIGCFRDDGHKNTTTLINKSYYGYNLRDGQQYTIL